MITPPWCFIFLVAADSLEKQEMVVFHINGEHYGMFIF